MPELQEEYLHFLRTLFKSSGTTDKIFAAAYMTGILPIKKDGSQSAISDFQEYSMVFPGKFAEYVGFTEQEVKTLCTEYGQDFEQMKQWYDGYALKRQAPFTTRIQSYRRSATKVSVLTGHRHLRRKI